MVEDGDLDRGEIVEQYPTTDGTVVERARRWPESVFVCS